MINIDIKSFALGVASNSGGGYPEPTGTKNITENGIHDVKDFAEANVNVPADIDALSVTANGTYTASECDGFSPVTVNVPNTYTSSDEGKVVNNGALASQTSTTKTANGTYDTTLNNEVVVNVPVPVMPTEYFEYTKDGDLYKTLTIHSSKQTLNYPLTTDNQQLTSIVLDTPNLKNLGSSLFQQCSKITQFNLPSTVETIGSYCFGYTTNLDTFTVPPKVTQLPDNTFSQSGIKNLILNNDELQFGPYQYNSYGPFTSCSRLESVKGHVGYCLIN